VILLVSHAEDDHLEPVRAALTRRGARHHVLDLADIPQRVSVTLEVGAGERTVLRTPEGAVDLRACTAVWWRRPRGFELDPRLDPDQLGFTYNEVHEAIQGLWATLPGLWVNPPWDNEWATYKGRQLALAAELGLSVPHTCITNDPDEARRFITSRRPDPVVYKSFSASEAHWRETRLLRPDELDLLDAVQVAPLIFQEYVGDAVDLRITAVGDELFAAAIHTGPSAYPVDFRMDLRGARFEPVEVPGDVADRLLKLLGRLGLRYGAIDVRRRSDGEHVFLEVNPAGQWRFVEERTGQPITEAVAALLASGGSGAGA
jgi:hypothetical protein